MQTAKILGSQTFRYTEPITLVGIYFLIFSLVAAALVRRLEYWLKYRWRYQGMNDQPLVHFEPVRKRYGPLVVPDALTLQDAAGEKVAVIGPYASGTTSDRLRAVSGKRV